MLYRVRVGLISENPIAINLPFGEDLYHPFMILVGLLLGLPLSYYLYYKWPWYPTMVVLRYIHYYRKWPLLVILVPLLTPIYRFFIYPVCTPNVSGVFGATWFFVVNFSTWHSSRFCAPRWEAHRFAPAADIIWLKIMGIAEIWWELPGIQSDLTGFFWGLKLNGD